jgi:hypothetical protein
VQAAFNWLRSTTLKMAAGPSARRGVDVPERSRVLRRRGSIRIVAARGGVRLKPVATGWTARWSAADVTILPGEC